MDWKSWVVRPGPSLGRVSCLGLLSGWIGVFSAAPALSKAASVQVEHLSRPREVDAKMVWTSPDGSRWAYAAHRGSRMVMVVDGRDVGPYSSIAGIPFRIPGEELLQSYQLRPGGAFTPDGQLFVFTAQKGDQLHVVTVGADGVREGPPLSREQRIVEVLMPPAGHRFAVLHRIKIPDRSGRSRPGMRMVLDGRNSADFAWVDQKSILFTPDGLHISYVAALDIPNPSTKSGSSKRVYHAVIDQTPGPRFDFIFNSNGQSGRCNQLILTDTGPAALYLTGAFMGQTGALLRQSTDGTVQQMATGIAPTSVVLTADRRHWAGVGVRPNKKSAPGELPMFRHQVYVDGKPVALFDGRGIESLTISPDGARSAFTGLSIRGRVHPVIDGKAGLDYQSAGHYTFSPDGKRLAYVAANDRQQFLVLDGRELGPFQDVSHIVFSPDGRRVAWAARIDAYKSRAFVDGKPGPDVPNPGITWMTFRPGNGRLVYMAGRVDESGQYDSRAVYFGLAANEMFLASSNPQLTADGKHRAFLGREGTQARSNSRGSKPAGTSFFVFDGQKKPMRATVVEPRLTFDPAGQFVASAGRNNFAVGREHGFSINGALVLPLSHASAPPRITDGRATVYGVTNDGELVRVTADMKQVAAAAEPTKSDTAYREQASWTVQTVEYDAFQGPMPGPEPGAQPDKQQAGQEDSKESKQSKQTKKVEQKPDEPSPSQPVDEAMDKIEDGKKKIDRLRGILGW